MSRYIDADKLLEQYKPRISDDVWKESEFYKIINDAPTADVVEVKHGKWIPTDSRRRKRNFECSECKNAIHVPKEEFVNKYALYCLRCGAKMDGAE